MRTTQPQSKERRRKTRAEMIKHLEDIINHPSTDENTRQNARKKLEKRQSHAKEREEHTEKVRKRAQEDMSTPEGMRRVVEFMANSPRFAQHSPKNIALLLADADLRGMTLTSVRKLSEWRSMGYKVIKGSKAFVQWVPMKPKEDDEDQRMRFRLVAAWFDRSQVEPIKKRTDTDTTSEGPAAAGPWALPAEPETGDRHAFLWLVAQAERDGLSVMRIHDIDVPAQVTYHEDDRSIGITIPPGEDGFPDYGSVIHDLAAILFERIRDRDARREAGPENAAGGGPEARPSAKAGAAKSATPADTPLFDMDW
jgi:hypothetical protein